MNKIIAILISAFLAGQTLAATVINVYPTNITTTSAYFQATISTNGGGSTGMVFYGFSDQTTNASSWSMSNDYGNITTTGTVSKQITNLQQAQKYYYRWRILEAGTYVWAAGTSNFWTKAASPTSTPTPVSISVQANPTTAALMAPTNFFNANTGLLNTALSGLFATDAELAAESNRAVAVEQQLGAAVTNLNTATNSLNTRAGALETSTQTLNTAVATLNTATNSINDRLGIVETNTVPLGGAEMYGPLTNKVSIWGQYFAGDGGGLTNLTAPAATNSDALGGQSAATWVAATGSLNTAVGDLNTATGSLNSAVTSLQTSTGTINTAVAALQVSTGSLNTAVTALNTSTGSLNTAVTALNTSTGSLNSTVGNLVTATQTLNSAVVQLQTDTGTIWTAVGTLNAATNSLNTRVTDLEGGGSVSGWSGYGATQQVFWTREVAVVTNIRVTGSSLTPAVQGDYLFAGAWNGTNYWACTNGFYIHINDNVTVFPANADWYIYNTLLTPPGQLPGDDAYFYRGDDPPTGDYTAGPSASGTPNAAYYIATNTTTWRAGPDPDDGQAWKLTLGGTNIYRAYAASNVFDKPIYGDGANISGVNATNAVTLAGLLASDYAKQANYAATSNLVDLTKSIADGLNSVSSMVNRVTTADYPATSNLVDAVKAIADGLNSESNNWHVAYTSVFHGAGSMGRVTSEAGDATKFLKGDGTWSDTPAAAYGTTDSTGYRGDWGAAVSNIATRVDANAITNPVGANVNFNTKDATNIGVLGAASLQITGGSPTNGAVFVATNTAGQGAWNTLAKIRVRGAGTSLGSDGSKFISLSQTPVSLVGNISVDGDEIVIAKSAYYTLAGVVNINSCTVGTTIANLRIYLNKESILYNKEYIQSSANAAITHPFCASGIWLTNGSRISLNCYLEGTKTTTTNGASGTQFSVCEMP